MNTYGLPPTYTPRLEPQYFHDTLADSHLWQAGVYRLAAELAQKAGVKRIVDIGCGRAGKLMQYANEFKTIGIDYGDNIHANSQKHLNHSWYEFDLNEQVVTSAHFIGSVVICADVIEHIPYPDALIETLRNACETAAYVLVSTPDRDRLAQNTPNGMPANPAHVREWRLSELVAWFESEGLPVVWQGWTISYDKQPEKKNTCLVILSKTNTVENLPAEYEMMRRNKPISSSAQSPIKVWMTPTPSEAARNPDNAIHNIVLRMHKHLPRYGVELVEYPESADLIAAHAGSGGGIPVDVAHYHGLYPTAQGFDGVYFGINAQVIRNLKSAKAITAPSEWIADVLRRDMHVNPHIIGWGVDTDEWTPGNDPHLYVLWNKARVDKVCDPQPMIDLAKRAHDVPFLTTFGEGAPNIRTVGKVPYETMKGYVRNAAVYLSSNVETFGIGILEACASGVPVLGFRQGAIAEYLTHGVNAFLAEPGDMDGLYEGLHYCLKHRKRLGANARELAKRFTWDKVARGFADVYKEALEPHNGVKVSVIIPCHNYEQYVGVAIESALKQETTFDYEVIVVLDRCTDRSAEIVANYANRGVKTITADNGNLSATRNDGIRGASGEYIVLLDADDKIGSPHFLQALADNLDADKALGVAFTGITVMDSEGKPGHFNAWPNGYDFEQQLKRRNQIPSCCMFRKEAWRRVGGFKTHFRYAEDAEFWLQVGSLGYTAKQVINEGWFHYRLHNNSHSKGHRDGTIPEPDWTEFYPFTKDNERPIASDGKPPLGSWPARFYDKPDVSIIIPVGKGHEQAVKNALHSVEGQTFRNWEAIVINDSGLPLDLENGYSWAKVINTRGYIGAGAARNIGLKQSKAPFVVFLDSDDMLKPRFLELTMKTYRQNGKYAYTDWLTHENQTNWKAHETTEYTLEAFFQKPSIHPITALIPRQWALGVGGFDESLPAFEDVDFYLKMLTRGYCGARVKEPLLIYNIESGFRRKVGEGRLQEFTALMTERYRAYMEGDKMCNCVEPPKGKAAVAPTSDAIISEYREAYGDTLLIQFTWEQAPIGAITFKGPSTRVNYGRRARNDTFLIWQKDYEGHEDMFTLVRNYETEPEKTVIPEPPPLVTMPIENVEIHSEVTLPAGDYPKTDASPVVEMPDWSLEPSVAHVTPEVAAKLHPSRVIDPKPRGKPGRKAKAR